jgi:HlyD family type I secretion membrane fusion protein
MSIVDQGAGGRDLDVPIQPSGSDDSIRIRNATAAPRWGKAAFWGYAIIGLFFGGFGGFAAFAELDSSIMAIGELRIDQDRRVVQHDAPGVITDILVRDGDHVEEGQVLLRLDPTVEMATQTNTRARLYSMEATLTRFEAERDGASELVFPPELLAAADDDPQIANILKNERAVFQARKLSIAGSLDLRLEQIEQIKEQIEGLKLDRDATLEQLGYISEELVDVRTLFNKGLERKSRVLALQREEASLRGRAGRLGSEISRMTQRIGETQLQIDQTERDFQREIATGIESTSVELQMLRSQMDVTSRRVERLEVRAPRTGHVIDLAVNTVGSFIQAGATLMQIVPSDEGLVVVAQIKPRDIEHVKPKEQVKKVQVRLTSFSQRFTHPIEAQLLSVSDDVISPPDGGRSYYKVILRIDEASKERILPGVELASGMPALAMLSVGETTLLNYLVEPLYLSISQALREPSIE